MHIPVLLNEVLALLNPQPNENFIDGTLGEGGHAMAILEKTGPQGKLLGIDLNKETLTVAAEKEILRQAQDDKRFLLAQGNFSNIKEIATQHDFLQVHG